jgi:RNA polymerase sigma-70 factor (ECF subfamily)
VRVAAEHKWGGELLPELRGARAVAENFKGRASGARPAIIDGAPGAVWAVGGTVRSAFVFTIEHGAIVALDLFMDADLIAELEVET